MNAQAMSEIGQAALERQFGARFTADWHSREHRLRRLLAEFIGTAGFMFLLSGGAAVLAKYGGADLAKYQYAFILLMISALWLVVAVYFLAIFRRISIRL